MNEPKKTNSPRYIINRARDHRKQMTQAESALWNILRGKKVCNLKFRRQYPVGRYIIDFCCPEISLIIEIDGDIHETTILYDANRESDLIAAGYCFMRFSNQDVLEAPEKVIDKIKRFHDG